MLEDIIILFFLTKNIGKLAAKKDADIKKWKRNLILFWIMFELIGITISMLIVHNLLANLLFGKYCGFGGYLFTKYQLEKMPNKTEGPAHWTDKLGN